MKELEEIRNVSFVGTGNVATHLATALVESDIHIKEVCSINLAHAIEFSKKIHCSVVSTVGELSPEVDLILVCVPDNQVKKVVSSILPGNAITAHTSGIVSLDEIQQTSFKTGVFYPLQSFSKDREVSFSAIPFCIEGVDKHTHEMLTQLAYKLSDHVVNITSSEREILHLTAVMVNNFTNRLYGMAHEILEESMLDFNLLVPLIRETAAKVTAMTPMEAQTGPARRNDAATLQRHQELLRKFPHYQSLYQLLTDQIIKKHHE